MQFLKILFGCLIAFIAAAFTVGNWVTVPIRLPGELIAEVNLPLLLLAAFLVGMVPTLLYQHVRRWQLRQRLNATERQLADFRALAATTAPPVAPAPPITASAPPASADGDSATGPGQLL